MNAQQLQLVDLCTSLDYDVSTPSIAPALILIEKSIATQREGDDLTLVGSVDIVHFVLASSEGHPLFRMEYCSQGRGLDTSLQQNENTVREIITD